jgi:N-alpha-acetyltransferase 35, NatC auxiliary subunit
MDPKMDSGYIPPDDEFEPDFDTNLPLPLEQVLWIMDQLFCLEIAWYDGYPLSQTVFTSLHVHSLLDPSQPRGEPSLDSLTTRRMELPADDHLAVQVLTAYCVSLIKCCAEAIELVQSQNYYEEEDFVTHTYGRDFLPHISTDDAHQMLEVAITALDDKHPEIDARVKGSLKARLEMRRSLLATFTSEPENLQDVAKALGQIKDSHNLAMPTPEAFSEKVQRQLATSTPPRPALSVSFTEACDKWQRLCSEVQASFRLTSQDVIVSPACLHRAVWAFSSVSRPVRNEPFPLARAFMQRTLFEGQAVANTIPHFDLLLTDFRETVLAGDAVIDPASFEVEVPTDPRHISSRLLEGFMQKIGDEWLNLYRMVCQNRCRIRRTFTQAIPILDALEGEAMSVDSQISDVIPAWSTKDAKIKSHKKQQPLTWWMRLQKLRVMAWTIQLGYETDIYLSDELPGMYCFLSELCRQRTELIELILRCTKERTRKTKDQNSLTDCLLAEEYLGSLHFWSEATRLLAHAAWKLLTLLLSAKAIVAPKRDFTSQNLLYEARMKCFLSVVHTKIPTAKDFESATQRTASPAQTCAEVEGLIKDAKPLLQGLKKLVPEQGKFVGTEEEWKKEIKGMEASGVAIAVAASQIRRASEKHGGDRWGEKMECKIEKRFADWWPVPVLKER